MREQVWSRHKATHLTYKSSSKMAPITLAVPPHPWQHTVSADGMTDRMLAAVGCNPDPNAVTGIQQAVSAVFHDRLPSDFVEQRLEKVRRYRAQLGSLLTLPQVEQRSSAWYNMRTGMITASDFAQALGSGKFGTVKQFYMKKSGYEEDKFDAAAPALRWGVMFEPVANDVYCKRNSVVVHEFGLLRHPSVPFFGASPDGITEMGVMVEIKCPFKRKITGEVPAQYYYQIQGQLDVCNLEECDYLECEFEVADQPAEFWRLYSQFSAGERGAIIEVSAGDKSEPVYSYSPIDMPEDELRAWLANKHAEVDSRGDVVVREHLWTLKRYNVVRVYRDPAFVTEKLELLSRVWANVQRYRADRAAYTREVLGSGMAASAPWQRGLGGGCMIRLDD